MNEINAQKKQRLGYNPALFVCIREKGKGKGRGV